MNTLNEKTVLDFYLTQIEQNNIQFLKTRTKYKKPLKDLISELRDEDNMHNKIEISKKLWKLLFETSMSYIDPDKRGYDELFKFFDKYVNFEELIFASDSFYRDHTLHCLWVYFLGEYIIKHEEFKFIYEGMNKDAIALINLSNSIEAANENGIFSDLLKIVKPLIKIGNSNDSIRCICALTHDLGYPIKKISKINKCIKDILPHFSIDNYDEFNFHYTDIQQNFIEDFIDLMSIQFHINFDPKFGTTENYEILLKCSTITEQGITNISKDKLFELSDDELTIVKNMLKMKPMILKNMSTHMRYFNDFEQYNHGIMSAYLLLKNINSFNNLKFSYMDTSNVYLNSEQLCVVIAKQDILKSISDHTSNGYRISSINDNSSFLILMDELEEFSRISRANQNRQYINEFCKTNIYMDNGALTIDFTFDNTKIDNLDPERAFKGRCHRFLSLFNINELDENLKIKLRCIANLPYDNNLYELYIARKFANISINGEEKDIPTYLKSNQFYSKEEYMNM